MMTGPPLAARWRSGKTGKLANIGYNPLQLKIEMAHPIVSICTKRFEDITNVQGQPGILVCQRLSRRARYCDIIQRGMERSKLTPKDTPALFEELDCTRRSTFALKMRLLRATARGI